MNIDNKIKRNIPLAPFTTFQIGGPAEYYLEATEKEDIAAALAWAGEKSKKAYFLGGGSNVLVPDAGVEGLVIRLMNDQAKIMGERLECGAGASLSRVLSLCTGQELSGLEWSNGIPRATVGGSIRGNAGAFGQAMADIVETVEIFNTAKGVFQALSARECAFGYRDSIFKKDPGLIIWQAVLKMRRDKAAAIKTRSENSINFRVSRYPRLPSAGSVFENLEPAEAKRQNPRFFEEELKDKIGRNGKISAGLIIDMCGLKGKKMGNIKVSLEHANHIVNTGRGRAEEVVMLISLIKQRIRDELGLELKEEIQYFGF